MRRPTACDHAHLRRRGARDMTDAEGDVATRPRHAIEHARAHAPHTWGNRRKNRAARKRLRRFALRCVRVARSVVTFDRVDT